MTNRRLALVAAVISLGPTGCGDTTAPAQVETAVGPTTTTSSAPATTSVAPTTTAAPPPRATATTTTAAPAPPATPPPPQLTPVVARAGPDPGDPATWDRLAACESGGNWATNTGNGYYGGLQFAAGTWRSVGGAGLPHENSREEQIRRGQILQARSGWAPWPGCTRRFGWR